MLLAGLTHAESSKTVAVGCCKSSSRLHAHPDRTNMRGCY
jgi:hypothetical protein